jgi:hypothetical protein
MIDTQNEILKRVNALQILLEALSDELIDNKLISQTSVLRRIEEIKQELDREEEEFEGLFYFGPKGEA